MITITIILLILINLYGFLYSLLITKYNYSYNHKIQSKRIDYDTLEKRLPLILIRGVLNTLSQGAFKSDFFNVI